MVIKMVGKLAIRNIRKSMSDYAVYFVTLIIGISIFYVFNAVTDQTVVINIYKDDSSFIDLLKSVLAMASTMVSVVLAFLIMYASDFLMKRRKKEFGVYMLLGMGKMRIASVLMVETVLIGILSLAVGLVIGVVLSQGMSILVANMFEADMTDFAFELSTAAVGKTVVYFLIMYALVLVLDVLVVGKSRLIRLLNAERRTEKNLSKYPWVCLIVFLLAGAVLCHAYYMVTANANAMDSEVQVVMQIVKGIVTTFLIFWSLSGLLIFLAKLRKKSYFKGINVFTTKEIASRINTNVFAGSLICLLLFITICVFASCFSVNRSMNDNMKLYVNADVNFVKFVGGEKDQRSVSDIFAAQHVDTDMFEGAVEVPLYHYKSPFDDEMTFEEMHESNVFTSSGLLMKASDYEKVAQFYGLKSVDLKDDEYAVVANYDYVIREYEKELENGHKVRLMGRELHPAGSVCVDGYLQIASGPTNFGFTVVPDKVIHDEKIVVSSWYYIANYNKEYSKGTEYIEKKVTGKKFSEKLDLITDTREQIRQKSRGLTAMVAFLGLYLGIIFLTASAALLSLKELSQASDSRGKYEVLRRLGVDERMIRKSLFRQNFTFFAFPLLLAIIHSVFGIQVCVFMIEAFGRTGLRQSIILTAMFILIIYMGYFVVTYRCSRKIIK